MDKVYRLLLRTHFGIVLGVMAMSCSIHACGRPRRTRVSGRYNRGRGYHGDYEEVHISVSVEWGFNKRAAEYADQPFHLRAEISPCHFNVYDTDKDGVISYDEMLDLVEDNDKDAAKQLFLKLDEATGDNVIDFKEFYEMSPKIIYGCAPDTPDGADDVFEEMVHEEAYNKTA